MMRRGDADEALRRRKEILEQLESASMTNTYLSLTSDELYPDRPHRHLRPVQQEEPDPSTLWLTEADVRPDEECPREFNPNYPVGKRQTEAWKFRSARFIDTKEDRRLQHNLYIEEICQCIDMQLSFDDFRNTAFLNAENVEEILKKHKKFGDKGGLDYLQANAVRKCLVEDRLDEKKFKALAENIREKEAYCRKELGELRQKLNLPSLEAPPPEKKIPPKRTNRKR
jgi:hypothetical protein